MLQLNVGACWKSICFRILIALVVVPAVCGTTWASDDWLRTSIQGCADGCSDACADELLTGPMYRQSEPSVQEDMTPFLQPSQPASSLFAEGVEGTLAAQGHAPGYIDWAMPRTQLRIRFDSGWDANRPDRAEFFYAQYGGPGPGDAGLGWAVRRADFRDIRAYLELAGSDRFSVFGELPIRFLQVSLDPNAGIPGTIDEEGLGDVEAGFKYALSTDPRRFLTFQLKTYVPTGNSRRGLGTNHVSIEPGFLFQSRINSRLNVFGELRDWIPVDGSRLNGEGFAGNVLRYGVGAAYTVVENSSVQISPITELVGWSVLDGQVTVATDNGFEVRNAATTIVNAKFGIRTLFKSNGSTLYVGYGNAITGQRWYEDFMRIEYTIFM